MRAARMLAIMLASVLPPLLAPAASAQGTPGWWRALYRGTAGEATAELDLAIDGGKATGRLLLPARGETLGAAGSAADDGTVTLTLTAPAARGGGPSTPTVVGSLQGRRSLAPDDDGSRFDGRLRLGTTGEPLTLTRIAQYVRVDVRDGSIHARSTFPRMLDPALAALDAELAPRARAELDTFVQEGRDARRAGALFHGWELVADTRVEGLAGPYVSLRTTDYRYTGGAHGTHGIDTATWWLDPSGPRRLSLAELFAPGTDYVARLAPLVLAGLKAQRALWVVQGQVTSLSAHDLARYTLTPAGIDVAFPPYAMGPYVQGSFDVTVPYARVLDLAARNGALEAFARAGR